MEKVNVMTLKILNLDRSVMKRITEIKFNAKEVLSPDKKIKISVKINNIERKIIRNLFFGNNTKTNPNKIGNNLTK